MCKLFLIGVGLSLFIYVIGYVFGYFAGKGHK